MIIAVLYVLLASYVRTSLAWGADGHHITCLLAEVSLSLVPRLEKHEFLGPSLIALNACFCVGVSSWGLPVGKVA